MGDKINKSVLFLSYDGLTDPLGQSQILPYICGLSENGYFITIVSFEKKLRYEARKIIIEQTCRKYQIQWHPLKYHRQPPVLSTLFNLYRMQRVVRKLHRKSNFYLIHCRSYLSALVGLRMKRACGVKFLFDMRGFWADERVEGGVWNLNNVLYANIYQFFKKKEGDFLLESDAIISLTHSAKKYLSEKFSLKEEKIIVIPCSVDLSLFDPEKIDEKEQDKLRSELGISAGTFVLLYLGSLGTWYLYDEMVSFFYSLKQHYPSAKFLFITPDKDKVAWNDDFIVREVDRDQVPLYCSIANAAIFFIRPSFSKMASSATKMGEVMAMRLPVITNEGWGDVVQFCSLTRGIFLNHSSLTTLPAKNDKIRDFVMQYLSLQVATESYVKVYRSIE
jgi:glycosyltransferase involved in cell wall biosynthesis